jgi:hypothetical protein
MELNFLGYALLYVCVCGSGNKLLHNTPHQSHRFLFGWRKIYRSTPIYGCMLLCKHEAPEKIVPMLFLRTDGHAHHTDQRFFTLLHSIWKLHQHLDQVSRKEAVYTKAVYSQKLC